MIEDIEESEESEESGESEESEESDQLEGPAAADARVGSATPFEPPNHVSPQTLKVDRAARPDWPTGADHMPAVGDEVYCTAGLCKVTRVLGRTGNGSRLLELKLAGADQRPFYAAASNVLVRPAGA